MYFDLHRMPELCCDSHGRPGKALCSVRLRVFPDVVGGFDISSLSGMSRYSYRWRLDVVSTRAAYGAVCYCPSGVRYRFEGGEKPQTEAG
jgi:hypothetical protein